MRQRITNIRASTLDVLRFSFESAGALEIVNEYSGYAAQLACYIAFAELKQRTSHIVTLSLWEVHHELSNQPGIYCLHWHRLG
jgi:ABC-type transport system involved in cytochrome bd biosynthesis fused ATPase/permease subunit